MRMKMKKRLLHLVLALILALNLLPANTAWADGTTTLDDFDMEIRDEYDPADSGKTFEGTVIVDENNVVQDTKWAINGMGFEWTVDWMRDIMTDANSNVLSQMYKDLTSQIKYMPSSRTAGHSIQNFNWESAIGPLDKRPPGDEGMPSNWTIAGQVLPYGPVEWVKDFQRMDESCQFIVALNIHYDTPEHLREYVEFLIGDAETTEWGAVRASLGLPDPVNVLCFELGNETNYQFPDPQDYIDKVRPVIDTIRAQFPDVKFAMGCYSYPLEMDIDSMEWRSWNLAVFEAIGRDCEYIQYHPYYDGQVMYHHERYLERIKEDLYSVIGENDVQFVMTEQACWPSSDDGGNFELSDATALRGCLSTAAFLNRMHNRTDVAAANYFCFYGSMPGAAWAVVLSVDGRLYLTGIAQMYNVYGDALGDKILYSEVASDSKYIIKDSYANQFTALASQKDDHTLSLILVNKSGDLNFDLDFEFQNQYTLVSKTEFTAPSIDAKVMGEDTKDIFEITTTEENQEGFDSFYLPAGTMVTLTLESDRPIGSAAAETDEVVYDGETHFTDIDGFWGNAEINLLAEAGIVEGVTPAEFRPNDSVTRAEFAAMLARMYGAGNLEDGQQIFSDVPADAWYAGAVAWAYGEGYLRGIGGSRFGPMQQITLEEAVTVLVRCMRDGGLISGTADKTMLEGFQLREAISPWAEEAVCNAVQSGLLSKFYENGYFNASAPATRGEIAVLLYRTYVDIGARAEA